MAAPWDTSPGWSNDDATVETSDLVVFGAPGDGKVPSWNATAGRLEWATPSGGGGASEQSTLSAFPSVNTDVHTGSGIVSWGLDASDGSAISIDGSDATKIHVTAGAYMVSVQGFINGTGTIQSINVGGTGIQTGDGATGGGSPQLILMRASVDTTFHVVVTVSNPGGSDHFNGGMDVFRI